MIDIKVTYAGLELYSPLIAGASDLTSHLDLIKKMEDAGAGAVVVKSLFEEQSKYDGIHAEMTTLFPEMKHAGPEEHLLWLSKTKEAVDIPIIASLNAVNPDTWLTWAAKLEQAGADALELNIYADPADSLKQAADIEAIESDIIESVTGLVKIPVTIKLSPFYTSVLSTCKNFDSLGVAGQVFFNQLFQSEIDAEKEEFIFPMTLSEPKDSKLPLRYAGLLYGEVDCSLCASTGVYTGLDVARMILGGADAVQLVSALYQHGIPRISRIIDELKDWMSEKGYESLDDFRGKMSRKNSTDNWAYKRAQYIKMLMKADPLH